MLILYLFLIVVFGSSGFLIIAFSDIENSILISIICFSIAFISAMLFLISIVRIRMKNNAEIERLANLPELTAKAKVFAKNIKMSEFSVARGGDPNLGIDSTPITEYFVSFEFNNRRENVEVDLSLYNTVKENETGLLTYKVDDEDGEFIFIDFKRD